MEGATRSANNALKPKKFHKFLKFLCKMSPTIIGAFSERVASSPSPFVSKRVELAFIFFVAIAWQILAIDPYLNPYDEGIILTGSQSILNGKLPYKDFWTMYGPGQFWVSSWLFSLLGTDAVWVRLIGFVSKALIATLAFIAIRKTSNRRFALVGAAAIVCILIAVRQDAFPIFPAVAFTIASMLCIERGIRSDRVFVLISGIMTGFVACFRPDLGAYNLVATLLVLLIYHWLSASSGREFVELKRALKYAAIYMLGVALLVIPVAAFLIHKVPFPDLFENLIYIPFSIYPGVRALSWPGSEVLVGIFRHPAGISLLAVYVPFLVCFAALINEIHRLIIRKAEGSLPNGGEYSFLIIIIASTGLLFTLKGVVRVSNIHMVQSIILSIILIPAFFSERKKPERIHHFVMALAVFVSIVLIGALAWDGLAETKRWARISSGSDRKIINRCASPSLPRLKCLDADKDYINVANFVKSNSSKDDLIYVGSGRHDKIFVNAVVLYFLAERNPVTKWYELHPGVQTQQRIQLEMVREMETHPPKFVILDEQWDNVQEKNRSSISSGVFILDNYFAKQYTESVRFGSIRVLAPKQTSSASS